MLRRLALVAFGLLAALVAAEAVLQVGALFVRANREAAPTQFATAGKRILAVGDSHTYGLYLERNQAYPAQLQQQWDGQADAPRVEVLNLGVPGTNSSKLRVNFDRILRTFKPDMVLIMVGSNDGWTVPVAIPEPAPNAAAAAPPPTPSTSERLWERSRVFRLLYMLAQNTRPQPPPAAAPTLTVDYTPPGSGAPKGSVRYGDEEIDLSFTQGSTGVPDWTNALAANLRAMVEAARAAGAQAVLMTYPTDYVLLGETNHVIRVVANQTGAPLIDLSKTMAAACRQDCGKLYLPDFHCTAAGNAIVAATVREQLAPLVAR